MPADRPVETIGRDELIAALAEAQAEVALLRRQVADTAETIGYNEPLVTRLMVERDAARDVLTTIAVEAGIAATGAVKRSRSSDLLTPLLNGDGTWKGAAPMTALDAARAEVARCPQAGRMGQPDDLVHRCPGRLREVRASDDVCARPADRRRACGAGGRVRSGVALVADVRGQRHVWIVVCADGCARGSGGMAWSYLTRAPAAWLARSTNGVGDARCRCGRPGHRAVRVELPRGRAR